MRERSGQDSARAGGLELVLARGTALLRGRVFLGGLAAVLLLACLAGVLAWRQYHSSSRDATQELRTRAVLAATVFDTYFAGQVSTLTAIADASAFRSTAVGPMNAYLQRVAGDKGSGPFTGGLAWIDRGGHPRVSTTGPPADVSVTDRSYFRQVVSTGKPFISDGLVTRSSKARVVVMAVPTHDESGRLTGVLTGALLLQRSGNAQRAVDLGYEGLVVIDRAGKELTDPAFAPPTNAALAARLTKGGNGVLPNTHGLDGSSGHVVAYAQSPQAGWTIALDQPRSTVLASARRNLALELASIGVVAALVLGLIGWLFVRSRKQADVARAEAQGWDALTRSIGGASDPSEVSHGLASVVASEFERVTAIVALARDDRPGLRIEAESTHGSAQALRGTDPHIMALLTRAYETARPVARTNREQLSETGLALDDPAGGPIGSFYAVPLIAASDWPVGALGLVFEDERILEEEEQQLLAAQAEEAARALPRARRHEREHRVAVELQRSLLPEELPVPDGFELAGRYQAGGIGLEVGGDWYDAVRRPDGLVHMSVGDVAGRGIPAASLMGQLRSAFRAYALDYGDPAEIARRLARHVPDDGMATALLLTVDPYTRELAYASCGHPPALLYNHDSGELTRLEEATFPPLGWTPRGAMRETRLSLAPRSTLLVYTDGLVERRNASIEDGIQRVESLLRELYAADTPPSAGSVADSLLQRIVVDSVQDDIALLVVEMTEIPSRVEVEIPANPSAVRQLRRRLRAWLALRGLIEPVRQDAVLAITEACNNAIEHAYDGTTGIITLLLEHADDTLTIKVEDHGSWRPPEHDTGRGLGIPIMRQTMTSAEINHTGTGTQVTLELKLGR